MSGEIARDTYLRARSDSEKLERRQHILATAGQMMEKDGLDGVSMSRLATEAGIAKGTIYLYFANRDELLVDVFLEKHELFIEAVKAGLRDQMVDVDFCRLFLNEAQRDKIHVELGTRLSAIVGGGISRDTFVRTKQLMNAWSVRLASKLETCLGLRAGDGSKAIHAMLALFTGALQIDLSQNLAHIDLPDDVGEVLETWSAERMFMTSSVLILSGLRNTPHAVA